MKMEDVSAANWFRLVLPEQPSLSVISSCVLIPSLRPPLQRGGVTVPLEGDDTNEADWLR